jgi:DNA-binding winged helix-turn-helix (wHTH) protein/Tfp pilus assembly protein PilF
MGYKEFLSGAEWPEGASPPGLSGVIDSTPMTVSSEPRTVVRFGVFEADLHAGDLRKKGTRVKIQDLPFRALGVLLSRPNEVVTREEFRQALWPQDVFVDFDRALSSAIKRLRDALGDPAENPIFIETIERRGYRWIAPTSIAPTSGISTSSAVPLLASGTRETELEPAASSAVSSVVVSDSLISPPAASFLSRKLEYAALVLAPLLVAAIMLFGFHGIKAAGNSPRSAANAALHPANQEARDLYLQGRYYWNKRTPDDLQKAVDYFTQAIVHDPGYSDAYVGLADCYNLLREFSAMKSSEAYPRALAAARKAVELDDKSSQAHASLAFASFWGMWDAATADREFRRAIELDPNNANAHHWYSPVLGTMGRNAEALAEIERAQALDPTSKSVLADKGIILYGIGRQHEAIDLLRQMEKAEPEFVSPPRYLQRIYLDMGDYPNYLVELRKIAVLSHDGAALVVASAAERGYAAGGTHAMFENLRNEQQKLYDQGRFSSLALAGTCALEGNKRDALKYLKIAYDQHEDDVVGIAGNRLFDNLHDDPEMQRILAGVRIQRAVGAGKN